MGNSPAYQQHGAKSGARYEVRYGALSCLWHKHGGISLSQVKLKAGCIKVVGKGAKERMLPFGKFVGMTLWHYVEDVRPQAASSDIYELFLSRGGITITTNTTKLVFSRLAKSSGVMRLHAHLCRHTFAVNYLLNGGDIFSLREILGHTTLEMVNHYLHFTVSKITEQHINSHRWIG